MSNFKNIKIENTKNSLIVTGDSNTTFFNKKDTSIGSKNITSSREIWEKVYEEIVKLQLEIRNLPDAEENLRDRELVPLISEIKGEASEIQSAPEKDKKNFLGLLDKITEIANKSALVFDKIHPYCNRVLEMIMGS